MTTDSPTSRDSGLRRSNSWSSLTVRALYDDVATPVKKPHSSRVSDVGHNPIGMPLNSPPLASPTSVMALDKMISSPASAVRNATASTKKVLRKVTKTLKRVAKSPTRKIDPFKSTYLVLDDGSIHLANNQGELHQSLTLLDILVDSTLPQTELEHAEEDAQPSSKSLHSLSQPRRKPRKSRGACAETENLSESTLDFDDSLFNDSLTLFRNKDREENDDSLPTVDDAPLATDEKGNVKVSASPETEEVESVDDGMDDGSLVSNAIGKSRNNHISWDFSQLLAMENLLGDEINNKRLSSKNKLLKAFRSVRKAARGSRSNKIELNDSMRTDRGQFVDDDSYQQDFLIVSSRESDPMNAHMHSIEEHKDSPSRPSFRHLNLSDHRYKERIESCASEAWKESPSHLRRHLSLSDHKYNERKESSVGHEGRPRRLSRRLSLLDVLERNESTTKRPQPERNAVCNEYHESYPEAAKRLGTDQSESRTKTSRMPRKTSSPSRATTSYSTGKSTEATKPSSWEGLIQKEIALGALSPRHRGSALRRASLTSKNPSQRDKSDSGGSPFEQEAIEEHDDICSTSPRPSGGQNSRRPSRKSNSLARRRSSHPTIRRSPSPVSSPQRLVEVSMSSNATLRPLGRNARRSSRRLSRRPRSQLSPEEQDSLEQSEVSTAPWPTTTDEEEHEDIQSVRSVSSRPMPRRRSLEVFQW